MIHRIDDMEPEDAGSIRGTDIQASDIVTDRNEPEPHDDEMLVVKVTTIRADEYLIRELGETVASLNHRYPPNDPVVIIKYIEAMGEGKSPKEYAFPASRLERVVV